MNIFERFGIKEHNTAGTKIVIHTLIIRGDASGKIVISASLFQQHISGPDAQRLIFFLGAWLGLLEFA